MSGRQIAWDANDWLKLLPLLRTAANMTANKGTVERCRIPAVAQLSPKISQTGALSLLLHISALKIGHSLWYFQKVFRIKGALVQTLIEFVPSYNAKDAHSIKYEVVFLWSEALFLFDCYFAYCTLLLEDFMNLPEDKANGIYRRAFTCLLSVMPCMPNAFFLFNANWLFVQL